MLPPSFLEVRIESGKKPLSAEMLSELRRVISGVTKPVREDLGRLRVILAGPSPLGSLNHDFDPNNPEAVAYVAMSPDCNLVAQEDTPQDALRTLIESMQLPGDHTKENRFAMEKFSSGQPIT